jgi:hypothetical protein
MDIHKNLEAIINVAKYHAKEHNCNYNIILMNGDENGNPTSYSTYEYVADSYFNKERSNALLLYKTDDLLKDENNNVYEKEVFSILDSLSNDKSYTYINPYDIVHDFPQRHNPYIRESKKINNNDLCSCGSGKKYKKCCK